MTLTSEERSYFRNRPFTVGDLVLIEAIGGLIPAMVTKVGRRGGVVEAVRRESKSPGIIGTTSQIPQWVTTLTFTRPKDSTWAPCGNVSAEILARTADLVIADLPPMFSSWEDAKNEISKHLTPVGREVWGLK